MHALLSMIKCTGGYSKFRKRGPKYFLARTRLLPLHMNVLDIMGDALECLKN